VTGADARRLEYIDGLRLVGAGAVVVQHLFERFNEPWAKLLVNPGPGVFGVVLFFMISGFVIPFSLRGGFDVGAFAIRRVARIYPIYLAVLALAFLFGLMNVAPYFRTIVEAHPGEWIANLLLVQDFTSARSFYSVSWTLAIEFIWYASFVILMKVAGRRAGEISAVAAPALMVLMTIASLAIGVRIPLGRPGMIYAAVLGYQTYRHHEGEISSRGWRVNLLVFLLVTLASNSVAFGHFHHPKISLMQAIGPWTAALILFTLAVGVPAIRRGLANSTISWLGATSYSIYMMHPLAIALAAHLNAAILIIPAALLLTLGMALLSYRFVELPGIRLGRSLSVRKARPLEPAAALS
jgi:peptidoglycan/LPS O-acetylase OafA/YrhL